ncbi:MAG: phenylalanine--tRNA ligase subunit beta [Planctomycetes bacterium]|nr:phenylalanine--tRNA ligase subunit beta [Planctomycetota bacterium]
MPIVDTPLDVLMRYINLPGAERKISEQELTATLPQMGCHIEEFADTHQYTCQRCDKIFDRTEAQGVPLNCTQCGTDFRQAPELLGDLGPNRVARIELLPVRADIFDPGGMARYVRSYFGLQTGLAEYALSAPKITVQVAPNLAQETSLRPYIACAVFRNVRLDHSQIKMLMNLQEDLHWALGRDRKLASIGVYDLDTLAGTTFQYGAVAPDGLKFVPLGFDPNDAASAHTPGQILERHKTGQAYAHLLSGFSAYPLLQDERGTVLSMPPIINSEATRVTMRSRQLFCDVTGLSQRVVDRTLNVMVTSLKEIMPAMEVERVIIAAPDGRRETPDLTPTAMTLGIQETARTIGVTLEGSTLQSLLERMGHGVAGFDKDRTELKVLVPAYRSDVMHPVDLIEDAAIAYGYDNLPPELVPTFTVGAPRAIEEHSATARRVLVGLGFQQVMTLVLTNESAAFAKWRIPPDPRSVLIDNPISTEQTMCRVSLRPGLLETLAINKQYDLPQSIFELGDCCFLDAEAETGASEERYVAAALIGTHVGYADIRAVADAFAHELGVTCAIEPIEYPSYIPGRAAGLFDAKNHRLGTMGEVHPEVLEHYGLKHPVAVLELSLAKLLEV